LLTLAGTWIGFHIQAREQRRVRQDNLIREGHLRLHAERLTSYRTFYLEGGHMRHVLRLLGDAPDDTQLREDAEAQRSTLWDAGTSVTLVGSAEAARAAWGLMSYARKILKGRAEPDLDLWVKLIWTFVDNARRDIQFPDAPDTPPLGLWEEPDP
jgi:hypothetical protein